MTWFHRLKSLIRYFLAVQRREIVRHHTASALDRLDDRLLADIGVTRNRIAEYARAAAHRAVPVPPRPTLNRPRVLAQLRSRRENRTTTRELSSLDDRLLRDIGIDPGRIEDVVDAMLKHRRNLGTSHPVVQLSDAIQEILVPIRHRPSVSNSAHSSAATPVGSGNRAKIDAERMPDVHALRARAANESGPPERRRRASAGR